jgi:hypothetical protein
MSAYDPIVNVGTAMQSQQGLVLFLLCNLIRALYRFWRIQQLCHWHLCSDKGHLYIWTLPESNCDTRRSAHSDKKKVFVHDVLSIRSQLSMFSLSKSRRFRPSIAPLPTPAVSRVSSKTISFIDRPARLLSPSLLFNFVCHLQIPV